MAGSMMNNATRIGMASVLCILLFSACKKNSMMPEMEASGRPYEVLVVMDDEMWERPVGRALSKVLNTDVAGLPAPEPSFHISRCAPSEMDYMMNLFRNIIEVDINPKKYTHPKMKYTRDEAAKGQFWITFQAPSEAELEGYFYRRRRYIIDFITKTEMNRLIKLLETNHSKKASTLAKEMFGCEIWAPEELKSSKTGDHFFWTSNNTNSGLVNLCMYSFPYYGPETFTKEYMLAKRDSVMMRNIPGEVPGMYMKTDTTFTECKPIVVHGQYAYECRGLWYMAYDAMGGPFVSHARVDTTRNLVIVTEGFVYAPEKMKRGLMRRMEGCLYTMMLPYESKDDMKK